MLSDNELVAMKIHMLEFLVQRLFYELLESRGDPARQLQAFAEQMRQDLEDSFIDSGSAAEVEGQIAIIEMLNAFWDSALARSRPRAPMPEPPAAG